MDWLKRFLTCVWSQRLINAAIWGAGMVGRDVRGKGTESICLSQQLASSTIWCFNAKIQKQKANLFSFCPCSHLRLNAKLYSEHNVVFQKEKCYNSVITLVIWHPHTKIQQFTFVYDSVPFTDTELSFGVVVAETSLTLTHIMSGKKLK